MSQEVPASLRRWFVIHFFADIAAAIPLFIAPVYMLELFGWTQVDPVTARMVAAALFGVGIESLLGRNAGAETFLHMINLKLIWSAFAILGTFWNLMDGGPAAGWAILGIFAAFHGLWWSYRPRVARLVASGA